MTPETSLIKSTHVQSRTQNYDSVVQNFINSTAMETIAWSPLPELHVGPNHIPGVLCELLSLKTLSGKFQYSNLQGFSGKIYLPKFHDHSNVYPW